MLEEIIIGLLIIVVLLLVYFNNNKGNSDIESLERLQLSTIKALQDRDTLDLKSIEDSKEASEGEAKILKEQIKELKNLINEEQKYRNEAYGDITRNINNLKEKSEGLEKAAINLHSSLKDNNKRGNWGEIQLKKILEHANMVEHIDYIQQPPLKPEDGTTQFPDVLVKMPNEKQLLIDSKSLGRLLKNYGEISEDKNPDYEKDFAEDVRNTMIGLSRKKYRENLKDEHGNKLSPDFIIMFMPGESQLQIALFHKPELWEESVQKKVILASPYILLALLKSVFYGWQQDERRKNTQTILLAADDIVKRMSKLIGYVEDVGDSLKDASESYDQLARSYNKMMLPAQRKINELRGDKQTLLELEDVSTEITDFKKK